VVAHCSLCLQATKIRDSVFSKSKNVMEIFFVPRKSKQKSNEEKTASFDREETNPLYASFQRTPKSAKKIREKKRKERSREKSLARTESTARPNNLPWRRS
jgi:hypothetical protein